MLGSGGVKEPERTAVELDEQIAGGGSFITDDGAE